MGGGVSTPNPIDLTVFDAIFVEILAFPSTIQEEDRRDEETQALVWSTALKDTRLCSAIESYKQQQLQKNDSPKSRFQALQNLHGQYLFSLLKEEPKFISELFSLHSRQKAHERLCETGMAGSLSLFDQTSLILGSRDDLPSSFQFQVEILDISEPGEEEINNIVSTTTSKSSSSSSSESSSDDDKNSYNFVINAECVGLDNLSFLATILSSESVKKSLVGLNLSSNSLGDEVWLMQQQQQQEQQAGEKLEGGGWTDEEKVESEGMTAGNLLRSLPRLGYLLIGGNSGLYKASAFTPCLPVSLRVLDLSFSEGLVLSPLCFAYVPYLLRLSLDGCSLSTTGEGGGGGGGGGGVDGVEGEGITTQITSVFDGLVSLRELSLKENAFETSESLSGLLWFGQPANGTSSEHSVRIPTLERLWLGENEVTREAESRRKLCQMLGDRIVSLKSIDNDVIREFEQGIGGVNGPVYDVMAMNSVRGVGKDGCAGGSSVNVGIAGAEDKGLDSMEKEYLAALKGERDVSVVA